MTLYEYMKVVKNCIDTYDNVFDACVTVDYIEDDEYKDYPDMENYYRFCVEILKKVEAEVHSNGNLIVKWNELIINNMEKFREFTNEHWRYNYEDDDDEFVYQWINEIHMYIAGYVDEDTYKAMLELLETI